MLAAPLSPTARTFTPQAATFAYSESSRKSEQQATYRKWSEVASTDDTDAAVPFSRSSTISRMSRAQWNMPPGALLGVKALAEMTNATENDYGLGLADFSRYNSLAIRSQLAAYTSAFYPQIEATDSHVNSTWAGSYFSSDSSNNAFTLAAFDSCWTPATPPRRAEEIPESRSCSLMIDANGQSMGWPSGGAFQMAPQPAPEYMHLLQIKAIPLGFKAFYYQMYQPTPPSYTQPCQPQLFEPKLPASASQILSPRNRQARGEKEKADSITAEMVSLNKLYREAGSLHTIVQAWAKENNREKPGGDALNVGGKGETAATKLDDGQAPVPTPEASVTSDRAQPARESAPVMLFVGSAMKRPLIPADATDRDGDAWDSTWKWFRRDAVITDRWWKLCWRQCAAAIDDATGVLIGGPLELVWTHYGSRACLPAANVDGPTADAAVFRFRQLYPGAAVPPIEHHMQPEYASVYKYSMLMTDSPSGPCMWLY